MNDNKIFKLYKNPSKKLIDFLANKNSKYIVGKSYNFINEALTRNWYNKKPNYKEHYKEILYHIAEQKSKMLDDEEIVKALYEVSKYYNKRIRNIEDWKRTTHNRHKQFESFVEHLFCKYPVPKFLYNTWFNVPRNLPSIIDKNTNKGRKFSYIEWFIDLGMGKNIRTCRGLPINMSKKMAHYFTQAPDNLEPKEAIMYSVVRNLGGDSRNVDAILECNIELKHKTIDFWQSVIKYFIGFPMLDTAQYKPIVDYITNIKYISQVQIIDGMREIGPPEKPNFSMKGRNIETLLKNVEDWHNKLNRVRRKKVNKWEGFKLADYKGSVGKDEKKRTFTIVQLLSSSELLSEGRSLNHCVSSYSQSCINGRVAIFSMTVTNYIYKTRNLLTISVNIEQTISEIRGKNNRLPNRYELSIVEKWADKNKLRISQWIKNRI